MAHGETMPWETMAEAPGEEAERPLPQVHFVPWMWFHASYDEHLH